MFVTVQVQRSGCRSTATGVWLRRGGCSLRNEEGQVGGRPVDRRRPEPCRLPGGRIKREPRYTMPAGICRIDEFAGVVEGDGIRMQPRWRTSPEEQLPGRPHLVEQQGTAIM